MSTNGAYAASMAIQCPHCGSDILPGWAHWCSVQPVEPAPQQPAISIEARSTEKE